MLTSAKIKKIGPPVSTSGPILNFSPPELLGGFSYLVTSPSQHIHRVYQCNAPAGLL
jgi:hypothetical protein